MGEQNYKIIDLIDFLCPLIKGKRVIKIWYSDILDKKIEDWRTIEPYLIGIHKDSGNYILSAWFRATQEQELLKNMKTGWKMFLLDKIEINKIEILDTKYKYTRKYYNMKDKRMERIFCATDANPDPQHHL